MLTHCVGEFKSILSTKTGHPEELLCLISLGITLETDEKTLNEYGLKEGSTLHLVLDRESKEQSATPVVDGASLLSPQLTPEEKMMQQMMDNPMVQQMMENPELMKSLFASNPQLQRLMDENPEIRHAMNDPTFMRQMMRNMRDPKLRLEMTRNVDRMMANAESLPGGFDALQYAKWVSILTVQANVPHHPRANV